MALATFQALEHAGWLPVLRGFEHDAIRSRETTHCLCSYVKRRRYGE